MEVQARWAYSEIVDGGAASHYDCCPGIQELRAQREAKTPFEQLTEVGQNDPLRS